MNKFTAFLKALWQTHPEQCALTAAALFGLLAGILLVSAF